MPQGPTGHVPNSLEGIEGDNVGYDETGALYSLQFGSGWWEEDAFRESAR